MVLKVRAFDVDGEKVIPISTIVGAVKLGREIFEMGDIVSDTITLLLPPHTNSETVIVNGLVMTEGATYDYTLLNDTLTFNGGVLTQTGHVLINYSHN